MAKVMYIGRFDSETGTT